MVKRLFSCPACLEEFTATPIDGMEAVQGTVLSCGKCFTLSRLDRFQVPQVMSAEQIAEISHDTRAALARAILDRLRRGTIADIGNALAIPAWFVEAVQRLGT